MSRRVARRLADHVRRARALLHEGGMGAGRIGRAGPVRSSAIAALPDAAAAGEVLGCVAGARRPGAGPSRPAVADGDQLATLQRPAGVPALRLLSVLHVRVPRQVDVDGDHAAARGSDRPLRDPVRTATSRASRPAPDGRATGVSYFDAAKQLHLQRARAVVLCANGGETPRLLLNSASSRFTNGLANSSGARRQAPDVQHLLRRRTRSSSTRSTSTRAFRTRASCSISTTPIRAADFTAAAASMRASGSTRSLFALGGLPPGSPTWGDGFARGLAEQFTRTMFFGAHGTSLPLETNSVTIDPALKDAWGLPGMRVTYKDHPDDLKNAEFLSVAGAWNRAGGRRAEDMARTGSAADPVRPSARHVPDGQRSADFGDRQFHRDARRQQSVHLRRQQHGDLVARTADRDDLGARVPGRRAHRGVCQAGRDLTIGLVPCFRTLGRLLIDIPPGERRCRARRPPRHG